MFRHRTKAIVGEVAQFTEDGENDSLIASWFKVHPNRIREFDAVAAHTEAGVARRAQRGKGKAKGDWIIRTKTGTLCICPEMDFEKNYVRVEGYSPRTAKAKYA